MATTPLSTLAVHTPPTPLHGAKYENYHSRTTRKGTRDSMLRNQRAIEKTPPPPPPSNMVDHQHVSTSSNPKKANLLVSAPRTYSPPSSTQTSPGKQSSRGVLSNHSRDAGAMDGARPSLGAPSLDISYNADNNLKSRQPPSNLAANMLPTPAKTPRKKPVQSTAIQTAARILFQSRPDTVEEAMPSPRKKRNKRDVGFSLYSSVESDDSIGSDNQIEIYTDSKDKVPELDPSEDNPFYDQHARVARLAEPRETKNSKKRKAEHSIDASAEIEEAFNHKEGMVYVFRGKKVYRKFANDGSEHSDPNNLEDNEREFSSIRPLTRSSIKPRLLFPTKQQVRERIVSTLDDEEAPTDIEDHEDHKMTGIEDENQFMTPAKAPTFSVQSPPTTIYATRATMKKATLDSPQNPPEPVEASLYERHGKKVSPFDGWARMKAGTSGVGSRGKKRQGEIMDKIEGIAGSKKVRSNGVV